jgi:uncharacterized protein YjbI with pentapeptide repeats
MEKQASEYAGFEKASFEKASFEKANLTKRAFVPILTTRSYEIIHTII